MSEDKIAPKSREQFLRDAFEGIKGRPPTSEIELKQWLVSEEGNLATLFDNNTLSPWGERGRS